ncbi:PREDICTED: endoplasmic reticulum metallopeptidase 1-like isoform X2 [Acropora digitifera]|uniref:endoplasmic reticulum metallopeptidase 1-like isoform X2 n=1 Tax=Acropora digitifera TaxID=70779 RepID=UPI00077A212B|nr:PREDICTED: endoplasmic reticulum metallopeptidase 1-like isoform X2 [Acropora digitifera]
MAELRKRGPNSVSADLPLQNGKESTDYLAVSSNSKSKSSSTWIFFTTLLFLLLSLYISFLASRNVPSPKTYAGSSPGEFIEENARNHLERITSFGQRVAGSYANEVQTVNYIRGTLEKFQKSARKDVIFEIDIQTPSGSFGIDFGSGFTTVYRNVTNILVRISPKSNHPPKNALLLNGHFDSVPGSPGANDDAVSCAVMLEIIRCLVQTKSFQFEHGLVFNFNGAEENVLQASHGFITQHPWVDSLKAFINLEAAGAGGRELVFQAGPEHPWLIKMYSELAPFPCAQALGQDVFLSGAIPSDTDFRIYRDYGNIPGMDLAYTANGYVYHTYYDTPEAVTPGSMQRAGDNIYALVKGILNSPYLVNAGEYRHGTVVFFDFLGMFMIHYPERIGAIINMLTVLVVILCTVKKFIGFPSKKRNPKEAAPSLSFTNLLVSVLILVLSWIVGIIFPVTLSIIVTHARRSLSWFCRPYLLIPLYAFPSLLGIGFVHFITRRVLESKNKAAEKGKPTYWYLGYDRVASCLEARETETFYASLLIWTLALSILTYYRLASAHLPLLFVIFPLVVRVFIWETFFSTKTVQQKMGKFMIMNLVAQAIPLQFFTYIAMAIMDVFVPVTSRTGTEIPPDVFLSVLCAFVVVVLTSYLISIIYVMDDLKIPSAFLVLGSVVALSLSLSGLSFPYSAANKCPKRALMQILDYGSSPWIIWDLSHLLTCLFLRIFLLQNRVEFMEAGLATFLSRILFEKLGILKVPGQKACQHHLT